MNVQHMRYVLEVARTGSINKASELLLAAQPNVSRAIKELEADLGIAIFDRSSKGMLLTPEGEEFVSRAQKIIAQIDDMENMCRSGMMLKQKFSISVPETDYLSEAFADFSRVLNEGPASIIYSETGTAETLQNMSEEHKLGIIRYDVQYERYFDEMFKEKDLYHEVVAEFPYLLVANKNSPLVTDGLTDVVELEAMIELSHADYFVPNIPTAEVKKQYQSVNINRRMFMPSRAVRLDTLSGNTETYTWDAPLSKKTLSRYGLAQFYVPGISRLFRDVLVYKNGYKLTELDKRFIAEMNAAGERVLSKYKKKR